MLLSNLDENMRRNLIGESMLALLFQMLKSIGTYDIWLRYYLNRCILQDMSSPTNSILLLREMEIILFYLCILWSLFLKKIIVEEFVISMAILLFP